VFVSDSIWNRDGSVSIVTRPRAGRFRFRIPAEVKYFSTHVQRGSVVNLPSYSMGTGVLSRL
jgi:hypothetical protein